MTRRQRVAVAALLGALVVAAVALALREGDDAAIVLTPPQAETAIVVHIDGAVATPGVVQVPLGARLADVVEAAGGLRADADVSGLNLAARMADGQRLTIPALGPAAVKGETAEAAPTAASGTATVVAAGGDRINLNTADATLLETLPGIGPVLAERIVAHREENGPFQSVDDLDAVPGISTGVIEQLRPLVTVDG